MRARARATIVGSLVALAAVAIGTGAPPPAAASGPLRVELLRNGDFSAWEDGVPVGWTVEIGAREATDGPASAVERLGDGPDGRTALRLRGDTETRLWHGVTQGDIPVAPGDVLVLGGWLRTQDVRRDGHRFANCQLGLQCFDAGGDLLFYQMPLGGDGTRPWTAGRIAVAVPPGAATVRVIAFLSMSGVADFAGVSLERLQIPPADPGLGPAGRWRADLALLDTLLRAVHPEPFAALPEPAYVARLAAIADQAGADPARTSVALMRLVAALGDAHTRVLCPELTSEPVPLGLWDFADGLHVTATTAPHAALLGGRVVRIGTAPLDTARARLAALVAHETDSWIRYTVPRLLTQPRLLHALGLVPTAGAVPVTVVAPDGEQTTAEVGPAADHDAAELVFALPAADALPLALQDHGNYWYTRVAGGQVAYLQYRQCREDPDRPVAAFAAEVVADLAATPPACFVLDLRANGGGDSRVLSPVFQGVARVLAGGSVGQAWVVTGRRTFSSAALNAVEFVAGTGARVIGEPMGNKPDHFGQPLGFTLPNTGVRLQCSARAFVRLVGDPPTVLPDVEIVPVAADWFAGRDPVLDWLVAHCR